MSSDPTLPEYDLTIVVTVVAGKDCTRRCLAALCSQVTFESTEIIVPYDRWSEPVGELAEEFPEVVFHYSNSSTPQISGTVNGHKLFDRRRAVGLGLARGRLVALTEDHAVPAPDWCSKLGEVHNQPYAAIGGAIENGVDRPMNWALYYCDFGRYGRPLIPGPAEYASDVNIVYKRERINAIRKVWHDVYHETTVNWALQSMGEMVYLDPRIVVYQQRPKIEFSRALGERAQWGRVFAETRVAAIGGWRRALYAAGSVFLPTLLTLRAARHMFLQRRSPRQIVQALSLVFCLQIAWAWGEFLAYCFNAQVAEAELRENIRTAL